MRKLKRQRPAKYGGIPFRTNKRGGQKQFKCPRCKYNCYRVAIPNKSVVCIKCGEAVTINQDLNQIGNNDE